MFFGRRRTRRTSTCNPALARRVAGTANIWGGCSEGEGVTAALLKVWRDTLTVAGASPLQSCFAKSTLPLLLLHLALFVEHLCRPHKQRAIPLLVVRVWGGLATTLGPVMQQQNTSAHSSWAPEIVMSNKTVLVRVHIVCRMPWLKKKTEQWSYPSSQTHTNSVMVAVECGNKARCVATHLVPVAPAFRSFRRRHFSLQPKFNGGALWKWNRVLRFHTPLTPLRWLISGTTAQFVHFAWEALLLGCAPLLAALWNGECLRTKRNRTEPSWSLRRQHQT